MDIAQGKIGDVGEFELDLVDGNFVVKAGVKKELVEGAVIVKNDTAVIVTPKIFLDKLKKLIPGEIDDAVIDYLYAKFVVAKV